MGNAYLLQLPIAVKYALSGRRLVSKTQNSVYSKNQPVICLRYYLYPEQAVETRAKSIGEEKSVVIVMGAVLGREPRLLWNSSWQISHRDLNIAPPCRLGENIVFVRSRRSFFCPTHDTFHTTTQRPTRAKRQVDLVSASEA